MEMMMSQACSAENGVLNDVIPFPEKFSDPMPFLKCEGFWSEPLTHSEKGLVDNVAVVGADRHDLVDLSLIIASKSHYKLQYDGEAKFFKKGSFKKPFGVVPVASMFTEDGQSARCVKMMYPKEAVSPYEFFSKPHGQDNYYDIELGAPRENNGRVDSLYSPFIAWVTDTVSTVTGALGSSYEWFDEVIVKKVDCMFEGLANKVEVIALPLMTEAGACIYHIHTSELRNTDSGKDLIVKNGMALLLIASGLLIREGQRARFLGNAALISGVSTAAAAYISAAAY